MTHEGSLLLILWFGVPFVIGFALTIVVLRILFGVWRTAHTASFTTAWCMLLVIDFVLLAKAGTVLWREFSHPRSGHNAGGPDPGIIYLLYGPIIAGICGAIGGLTVAVLTTLPAAVTTFLSRPFKNSTISTYFYIVLGLVVGLSMLVLYAASGFY